MTSSEYGTLTEFCNTRIARRAVWSEADRLWLEHRFAEIEKLALKLCHHIEANADVGALA